jgi:hypothetical protein
MNPEILAAVATDFAGTLPLYFLNLAWIGALYLSLHFANRRYGLQGGLILFGIYLCIATFFAGVMIGAGWGP